MLSPAYSLGTLAFFLMRMLRPCVTLMAGEEEAPSSSIRQRRRKARRSEVQRRKGGHACGKAPGQLQLTDPWKQLSLGDEGSRMRAGTPGGLASD